MFCTRVKTTRTNKIRFGIRTGFVTIMGAHKVLWPTREVKYYYI
jgi:hypothetical protein